MDAGTLQFGMSALAIAGATVAIAWSMATIVRRKSASNVTGWITSAMSAGVILWGAKFLVSRPSRGPLEGVSVAGMVLFGLAGLVGARRSLRTEAAPAVQKLDG